MRILYIGRYHPDRDAGPLKRLRRNKTRYLQLRGQCGFMRAALHTCFATKEASLAYLRRHAATLSRDFDALIVCSKSDSSGEGLNTREFDFIAGIEHLPKALFISNPEAGFMPDDRCLDCFDIVFKREHFRDLERYAIAARNQAKIRLAWLACPLVPARRFNVRRIRPGAYGYADVPTQLDTDVCFFGTQSSRLRPQAWARVLASGLTAVGGIQPHDIDREVDAAVYTAPVKTASYIEQIRRSRVNLALEGLGEFTHRHYELWLLCSFCLSSPSVRGLALPGDAREGRHFVCFDDLDDMIDKIRYYAGHDNERERIARAGRVLFEEIYDFRRYGAFIARCLNAKEQTA